MDQNFLSAWMTVFGAPALPRRQRGRAGDLRLTEHRGVVTAWRRFEQLPASSSALLEIDIPAAACRLAHHPDEELFVGGVTKSFILAQYLRGMNSRRLGSDPHHSIHPGLRVPGSPVLGTIIGSLPARSMLEAMTVHDDNTAADIAMAITTPLLVRELVHWAGLRRTHLPDSMRRFFLCLDGDMKIDGLDPGAPHQPEHGHPASTAACHPLNDRQTMSSTASELVHWYRRVLRGDFFLEPNTLAEFRRMLASTEASASLIPADTKACVQSSHFDWKSFHASCMAGQMIVRQIPVNFCFTLNWHGPAQQAALLRAASQRIVTQVLQQTARAIRMTSPG